MSEETPLADKKYCTACRDWGNHTSENHIRPEPKVDQNWVDKIPDHIFNAAKHVGDYMSANFPDKNWELCGLASRSRVQVLEQRIKELEKDRDEWKSRAMVSPCKCTDYEIIAGHLDLCSYGSALKELKTAQAQCAAQFKFLLMLRDAQVSGVDFSKGAVDKIQGAFKEVLSPSCGSALLRRLESAERVVERLRNAASANFMSDMAGPLLKALDDYDSARATSDHQTKDNDPNTAWTTTADNAPESPKSLGTQKPKEV